MPVSLLLASRMTWVEFFATEVIELGFDPVPHAAEDNGADRL